MGQGVWPGLSLDTVLSGLAAQERPKTPDAGLSINARALASLPEGPGEAHAAATSQAGMQPCAQGTRKQNGPGFPRRPGLRPRQHTRTPPWGPPSRGAGGCLSPGAGEPTPGQLPRSQFPVPCLTRAGTALSSGQPPCPPREDPLPSEAWKCGKGQRSRAPLLGVPLGVGFTSRAPHAPLTAPGPCPVAKCWARGPAAGLAGQRVFTRVLRDASFWQNH